MQKHAATPARLNLKQILLGASLAVFAVALPLLFQNCSQTLDESSEAASVASGAPFAFETKIDQIAYMSCSGMTSSYDTKAFFTFKAGAYGAETGVRLNANYVYHARNLTATDKALALSQSPANQDAIYEMSLRPQTALQTILQIGALSVADFVGPLTHPSIANVLAQKNGTSFVAEFPELGAGTRLEDTIHFTQNEPLAVDVRDRMMTQNLLLALTYNRAGADAANALAPEENSISKVYGTGYKLGFGLGAGQNTNFATGVNRVVTSATEYDLVSGQPSGAIWDCKPDWRFMIVKPGDLGSGAFCENHEIDIQPTAAQAEMYQALRRMLPFSDWGVNLNRRCLVPKKTGLCYGNSTATINYLGGNCNPDPVTGNCPHYVSICKRR